MTSYQGLQRCRRQAPLQLGRVVSQFRSDLPGSFQAAPDSRAQLGADGV